MSTMDERPMDASVGRASQDDGWLVPKGNRTMKGSWWMSNGNRPWTHGETLLAERAQHVEKYLLTTTCLDHPGRHRELECLPDRCTAGKVRRRGETSSERVGAETNEFGSGVDCPRLWQSQA